MLFYVASRGHHEDIGGLTPGSMTPRATTIDEEGVYIDNVKLVEGGRFLEAETRALLDRRATIPARQPDKNIADLKAQVAANAKGEAELKPHGRRTSASTSCAPTWATCRTTPRRACAGCFRGSTDGHFRVETDQGTAVEVRITVDNGGAHGEGRLHRHERAAARPTSTRPSR